MKKILLINGHPDPESFGAALCEAYKSGALEAQADIKEIIVGNLDFNPNLAFGYRKRTDLEPDLIDAIDKLKWAEHIVLVFPVWWGSMPAVLKGFFDRTFLPGIAFEKRENSVWWDRLLIGKTGHIITTLDQPVWYYWLNYGRPTHHAVKRMTFEFCGIKPVKTTTIGPIRLSKDSYRANWLHKIKRLGVAMK